MTSQTNTLQYLASLTIWHRPLLFRSRSLGLHVLAAYVVSNGWKWRSGTRWRSRCFPLITSWQSPIWCGRAAATTTDFLPTRNKHFQRGRQEKMGWVGNWGNELGRYYRRQNNKLQTWDRPPEAEMLRFHMDPKSSSDIRGGSSKNFYGSQGQNY